MPILQIRIQNENSYKQNITIHTLPIKWVIKVILVYRQKFAGIQRMLEYFLTIHDLDTRVTALYHTPRGVKALLVLCCYIHQSLSASRRGYFMYFVRCFKQWRQSCNKLPCLPHHHSTNSSWFPQTSRNRLLNIDEPHMTRYDLIFILCFPSNNIRPTLAMTILWCFIGICWTPYFPLLALSFVNFSVKISCQYLLLQLTGLYEI